MPSRAVLTILIAACVAGCGQAAGSSTPTSAPPTGKPTGPVRVDIHSFEFNPAGVVVKKGGTITWTNSDAASHTATADDRSFDTQTINHGKSRTVVFKTPGTFKYHCDFHPFMKATVVVK